MTSIQACRDAYAKSIVTAAGSSDPRLIAAFASTERERFLGPPPWPVLGDHGGPPTPCYDPRRLYHDVLVGLATDRGINNGQPSLHAMCLAACAPQLGDSVVHVGAGTGYYSAVLAALVGRGGSVLAYEIEADLAGRARANLHHLPWVRVVAGNGARAALPPADIVYVSAGATQPPEAWLDALKPGGRLVFPLTPALGYGGMLRVTRRGGSRLDAAFLARVSFIACIGARDDDGDASPALAEAFATRPIGAVRSLRHGTAPDATAWYAGSGWWLSTAQAG